MALSLQCESLRKPGQSALSQMTAPFFPSHLFPHRDEAENLSMSYAQQIPACLFPRDGRSSPKYFRVVDCDLKYEEGEGDVLRGVDIEVTGPYGDRVGADRTWNLYEEGPEVEDTPMSYSEPDNVPGTFDVPTLISQREDGI